MIGHVTCCHTINYRISALFLLDQLKSKIKEDGTPLVQLYVSPPLSSSASSSSASSTQQDSLYSIHMMCDTLQPNEEVKYMYIYTCIYIEVLHVAIYMYMLMYNVIKSK